MNQIQIRDFVLVEVPKGGTDYLYMTDGRLQVDWVDGRTWNSKTILNLPKGNYQIVGLAKDLTEDQWKEIVEIKSEHSYNCFPDFTDDVGRSHLTATASGHSLLKANNLTVDNCLIIKKVL